jgi:outer membrane protein assembly factor BamD (BamD/ComL family)
LNLAARLDLNISARYRQNMNRRFVFLFLAAAFLLLTPFRSPAPLIYAPGEGWYYEPAGSNAKWTRTRAKDQLEVAEEAFKNKDYSTAKHAAYRILKIWPQSDYAPRAQYLAARCLEMEHRDEAAFDTYQALLQKHPANYEEILWRQYDIATRFYNGEFFRIFWGYLPLYTSMSETAKLYGKIVDSGPYSSVGPKAQMQIGATREKDDDYDGAVKAYETAADRYNNLPVVAADAMYRWAQAYQKQSTRGEYDQGKAGLAIGAYTDFMTIFPDDKRVPEAQKAIVVLKAEQVRGSFLVAQFYENSKTLSTAQRRSGAIVYYNEVLQLNPNSPYAAQARERIEALKPLLQTQPAG